MKTVGLLLSLFFACPLLIGSEKHALHMRDSAYHVAGNSAESSNISCKEIAEKPGNMIYEINIPFRFIPSHFTYN